MVGTCEICGEKLPLTRHHIRPKVPKSWRRLGFHRCPNMSRESEKVMCCRGCHTRIHRRYENIELWWTTKEILIELLKN